MYPIRDIGLMRLDCYKDVTQARSRDGNQAAQ